MAQTAANESKSSTLTNVRCALPQGVAFEWESTNFWFGRSVVHGLAGLWTHRLTGLSFSGSNQAREGRLVDALAARGDEGRDTLR